MSEVIKLADRERAKTDMDRVRLLVAEGAASHELMHEHVPVRTRLTRWILRQSPFGVDYEQRLLALTQVRLAETGVQNEVQEAQILNFKSKEEE